MAAGMGPDVIGRAEFAELVAATVEEMVDIAPSLPGGRRRRAADLRRPRSWRVRTAVEVGEQ